MRKAQMFHLQGRQEPHALGHTQDNHVGLQYMFEFFLLWAVQLHSCHSASI